MAAPNGPIRKSDAAIRTGLIAGLIFAVGLLAGVFLASRSGAPVSSIGGSPAANTNAPIGAAGSGSPAMPKAASYTGTVKEVLKDGLLVEAPKQKADEPSLVVKVGVTDKTVLWANVPKTAAELSAGAPTSLPAGSVPAGAQAVPPPAPSDALKDPFKKVSIALGDFKANDIVRFVTSDNPLASKEVAASEIGWIAVLVKPAADGSPAQMSPDPGGRFGSAPPLPSGTVTAPEGGVAAPAAAPPAKQPPPPPPAPSGSTTSPSGSGATSP